MVGILTEITPMGRLNVIPVRFRCRVDERMSVGEFENIGSICEAEQVLRQFEHEMRRKYAGLLPNIQPDSKLAIKKVIFNNPATIVIWSDNTKTVVKCQPYDTYSKELGLAMCISKKFLGNKGNFNEEFKKWIPEEPNILIVDDLRDCLDSYCHEHTCSNCALGGDICRCGSGAHFKTKNDNGEYSMSDDEIKKAYIRVFGN